MAGSSSSNDVKEENLKEDGKWRSAMEGSDSEGGGKRRQRKGSIGSNHNRFSSFRHERASTERDIHPHEEESDHEDQPPSRSNRAGSSDTPGEGGEEQTDAAKRWQMLRSRVLPSRTATNLGPMPGVGKTSALAPTVIASLPITTELMAGQLPVMILKTWLDRDEDGNRAVPVLLGNLRFRVGDSVGLKEGEKTGREMFKLECEYGDGAVRWVSLSYQV